MPAEIERRHRVEQLRASPERADARGAAHLVRREGEEVAAERLDVDRSVRRRLRGVHDHDPALLVRPFREALDRIHRSERVRDEVARDDLDVAVACDLVERVELQLTEIVDRDRAEAGAVALRDVLPRDVVGVVLELGDDDEVARTEVVQPPRVRDEVDAFRGAAREDDLAGRRRVDERTRLLARALVAGGRALGELVDAAVHVRVRVLVEVTQRVEHLPRLLRRRRRVQEGDRLAVPQLLQVGEVCADALRVELRLGGDGHCVPSYRRAQTRRCCVAQRVSSCRDDSWSLRSTFDTWLSTVFTER